MEPKGSLEPLAPLVRGASGPADMTGSASGGVGGASPRTTGDASEVGSHTIARMDELASTFQKEGRYLEALEALERGLVMRHRVFGASSAEVFGACKATAELCNLLAMTYLQREEYPMVAELLKKAEILTEHDPAGRAVTYNNFACYSRQQGKLHAALMYLQKALKLEQRLVQVENPADTHLNLCAVLSQLGKHREALEHAQAALTLLQQELFRAPRGANGEPAPRPDRVAVLAICYHNIGVECEFLKLHQASLQAYTKGVEIASVYLGDDHGIAQTLKRSQAMAKRVIERAEAAAAASVRREREAETTRSDHSPTRRTLRDSKTNLAKSTSPRAGGAAASFRNPAASPLASAGAASLRM